MDVSVLVAYVIGGNIWHVENVLFESLKRHVIHLFREITFKGLKKWDYFPKKNGVSFFDTERIPKPSVLIFQPCHKTHSAAVAVAAAVVVAPTHPPPPLSSHPPSLLPLPFHSSPLTSALT